MTIPEQFSDNGRTLTLIIERSGRLKKSVRWSVNGDELHLRVPTHMTAKEIAELLDRIRDKIFAQASRRAARSDAALQTLARKLNRQYFGDSLSWASIRWVSNMEKRLGSCTIGGPTDGDIRISTRLQAWPNYVLEYVIAHEICHRKYPDHSPDFWTFLANYPMTERARGFIEGIAYVDGTTLDGAD